MRRIWLGRRAKVCAVCLGHHFVWQRRFGREMVARPCGACQRKAHI